MTKTLQLLVLFSSIALLASSCSGSDSAGGDSAGGDSAGSDTDGVSPCVLEPTTVSFVVTDAMQEKCYGTNNAEMSCPATGASLYGQDAQYATIPTSYTACEGVVTDHQTGLMWEQAHHDTRVSYTTAETYCESLSLGGYDDWRMPSIRELFSIHDARGDQNETDAFYLDKSVFDFAYPTDLELTGSHMAKMMGQTWSSTPRPDAANINFFYNFLDAHIKSQSNTAPNAKLFYRCVRGDAAPFQVSSYTEHDDGTVTDNSTGLMWQQENAEQSVGDYQFNWEEALAYCETLSLAGYEDWKLPDVKELQSLVHYDNPDYETTKMVLDTSVFTFNLPAGKDLETPPTSSPATGAAIGPFFWSSTTHGDANGFAAYVCFGPCWAIAEFGGTGTFDAHGPGAQRSDPKKELPSWPESLGDQKDLCQIYNFVRCVRRP